MGTWALVGVEQKDKSIKYRKIFSDGYLSGAGVFVLQNLNTAKKAKKFNMGSWDRKSSDILVAENEESFKRTWFCVSRHYLYRNNKWYVGSWHYDDGYLHDIFTGEKTKKVREETLECEQDWEPLEEKFIKKRRVVYDYIEINPEGEE